MVKKLTCSFIVVLFMLITSFTGNVQSTVTDENGVNTITPNPNSQLKEGQLPEATIQQRPKNVIVMVGDGMGIGQLETAHLFEHGTEGRLFMETLPNVALVHTYSANNIVTDSAAGGTAIATGKKTNNKMIGVTPNGKKTPSILEKFKQDGKKVGIVTTSTVTDATPAAFSAKVVNRFSDQPEIARQQFEKEIDVLLGGGRRFFEKEQQDGVDLINKFKEKGYSYASNKKELLEANGDKLLGLFQLSYLNFVIDRENLHSQEPTLPEMTQKAIDVLTDKPGNQGFFLLVEGGRIDHASHAADLPSIWQETVEFDHSVKLAAEWAAKNGNTLVIVLADHETMGISATEPFNLKGLKQINVSTDFIASQLEKEGDTEEFTSESIRDAFEKYAHIKLSDDEIQQFKTHLKGAERKIYSSERAAWEIGSIIAAHNDVGVVSRLVRDHSSTGGHTGNLVPLFAYGAGAEVFEGVLDNTDIPKMIAELLGYEL